MLSLVMALALALALPAATAQAAGREILAVKTKSAKLRQKPSSRSRLLVTFSRDYPLRVLERKKGWCRVEDFLGWEGWLPARRLGNTRTVVVTKNLVNIRRRPSPRGRVVLKAKRFVTFMVLRRQGQWLRVKHRDGEVGWLHREVTWGSH
ncbi:MAG: SH3 domain-containing protein [Pseudomonadota bacterium]